MATVKSYGTETLPDGRVVTVVYYDNGLIERVDENNLSLGYEYAGATPLADLSAIPSGQAVVVDDRGYPVKDMQGRPLSAPVPEGVQTTQYQTPGHPAYDGGMVPSYAPQGPGAAPVAAPVTETSGYDYSSGRTSYGSGGARGGYTGGGGYNPYTSSSSQTGGFGPRYADGSQHPLQGGAPRVPGGTYRGPDGGVGGGTGQQQVFVPGGAAAGPYNTSAASNWPSQVQRMSPGGGGGGGRSSLYSALRAKGDAMAAKVRGMGSGGAATQSSGPSTQQQYAKQQHQYNKEARQQQRAYDDGSYLYDSYKMRGFSKKMDPQQAEGLMFRPSMLLPKVAKGVSLSSPRYEDLANLPAAQLSMLRYGSGGKAREGPSQFTNNLAKFYRNASQGDLPSYDQLTSNLATARNKSALGQMFAKQPLGYGADNYESMVTSIFGSTGLDPQEAAARTEYTQGLMDQYGSRMLTKKTKKAQPINRWVAERSPYL